MTIEQFSVALVLIFTSLVSGWQFFSKLKKISKPGYSGPSNLLIARFLLYTLASVVTLVIMAIVKFL